MSLRRELFHTERWCVKVCAIVFRIYLTWQAASKSALLEIYELFLYKIQPICLIFFIIRPFSHIFIALRQLGTIQALGLEPFVARLPISARQGARNPPSEIFLNWLSAIQYKFISTNVDTSGPVLIWAHVLLETLASPHKKRRYMRRKKVFLGKDPW